MRLVIFSLSSKPRVHKSNYEKTCNKTAGNAEWISENRLWENKESHSLLSIPEHYPLGRLVNLNFKYLVTSGCPEYILPSPSYSWGN